MDDMMMMEEKKEEDEGPNGCIKCLGATWEVIYVSTICLVTFDLGNILRHQICCHDHLRGPQLLLVPHQRKVCYLLSEL